MANMRSVCFIIAFRNFATLENRLTSQCPSSWLVVIIMKKKPPPVAPTPAITIQYIEFTYCNDRFPAETLERKTTKYQPLLTTLISNGWQVAPLIVLASGARATTHIPSMNALGTQLKLPTPQIKNTFRQINIIAIKYAHSILIHKRRIENK
jgi:hypothetical protein